MRKEERSAFQLSRTCRAKRLSTARQAAAPKTMSFGQLRFGFGFGFGHRIWKTPDMSDATFACPDLTTFARLDERGLEAAGQRLQPDRTVLACRVVEPDRDAATQLRY